MAAADGGVVDLSNLERQRKLMSALPVDEVWGLDGGSAKNWTRWGSKPFSIWRIQDIRFIRKHFNVALERTVRELRGEPRLQPEGRTDEAGNYLFPLGERITDYPSMRQAIYCSYAARAAENSQRASILSVYLHVY